MTQEAHVPQIVHTSLTTRHTAARYTGAAYHSSGSQRSVALKKCHEASVQLATNSTPLHFLQVLANVTNVCAGIHSLTLSTPCSSLVIVPPPPLASPTTRSMMVRDMHIRKFQKENLDDLFAVIREKPSGLACLKRFADEQLMGGDVGFFIDVEGERQTLLRMSGFPCEFVFSIEHLHPSSSSLTLPFAIRQSVALVPVTLSGTNELTHGGRHQSQT